MGEPEPHLVEPAQGRLGVGQGVEGEVELLAVVDREEEVAHGARAGAPLQQLAQGVEVAERLGHLLAVDDQVLGVQPGADERLAGGRLALGDLVLVVGEDVVHAAGVDVEALAEVLHAHRRALDVPAGPAGAPGRVPAGLARLGPLP